MSNVFQNRLKINFKAAGSLYKGGLDNVMIILNLSVDFDEQIYHYSFAEPNT